MVENCYILYPVNGNSEPIVSNYSGLTAYTSGFAYIETTGSTSLSGCYYVLNIGVIDCTTTEEITIDSGITCSATCYCYFIKTQSENTDVTYVNCNDEIVVDSLISGLTYNICSKTYPQFDAVSDIPLKVSDICVDNQCPPTLPTVKPANECDVITLFPMNVQCLVQQPTDIFSYDGATTLLITGGTPPYTIFWEVGSFAPALNNLGVGNYTATVTDYYGDFTAVTTCVLTAETIVYSAMCFTVSGIVEDNVVYITSQPQGNRNGKPYYVLTYGVTTLGYIIWQPQYNYWSFCQSMECQNGTFYSYLNGNGSLYPSGNTWTTSASTLYQITNSYIGNCNIPIIPKTYGPLCVFLLIRSNKPGYPAQQTQIEVLPSADLNGQPTWTSSDDQYYMYWNTGSTPNQWTLTGYTTTTISLIDNDPSSPPLSNWQVLGVGDVLQMTVLSGACSVNELVGVSTTKNNALCGNDGSITITAVGGTPPYQYSINGGTTYQTTPIFLGLTTGYYNIFVKDSNNVIGVGSVVNITSTLTTSYNLTLTVNTTNNTFVVTSPILPAGVTITFDLTMTSNFYYFPQSVTPTPTYNNITTINGVGPMSLYNTASSLVPLTGPCTSGGPINRVQQNLQYLNTLTIGSNQTITGSTTNQVINAPSGYCKGSAGNYQLFMTNGVINNCNCCTVNLINPVALL